MSEVNVQMDGGAHTLIPATGGEVWVEHDLGDNYHIGAESPPAGLSGKNWATAGLSRKELKAFRREISRVLKDTK